jgi:CheY-like chemotaxis protein
LESEVGKGSAFNFTLNLGVCKQPPLPVVPLRPSELGGLPVLVVNDNDTNRRILEGILKNWRMRPASAESGPEALTMIGDREACLKAGKDAYVPKPLKPDELFAAISKLTDESKLRV